MSAPPPAPSPPPPGRRPAWRWLRRHFGYSRAQNRGLLLLLLLTSAILVIMVLARPDSPVYLPAADQRQLDAWAAALEARIDSARLTEQAERASRYPRYERRAPVPQIVLAPFDPNALSAADWEARGVPRPLARGLYSYGQKAGGYRAKEQLRRLRFLPDSVYRRLAPFLLLPDSLPRRAGRSLPAFAPRFSRKPTHLQPFDLNLADTAQLRQIRGIGAGRALYIVRHRTELGGFVSEEQLREVFVLRDAPDLVDSVQKYTFVALGFAPQATIHLNSGSFDDLWPHPYVGKNLARFIVAYRKQHGSYTAVDELLKLKLVKPEEVERLRPYARCD